MYTVDNYNVINGTIRCEVMEHGGMRQFKDVSKGDFIKHVTDSVGMLKPGIDEEVNGTVYAMSWWYNKAHTPSMHLALSDYINTVKEPVADLRYPSGWMRLAAELLKPSVNPQTAA